MSSARQTTLRPYWTHFVTRMGRICRRPLLVNLRGLLELIPFQPLDINCLYFLEYAGVPPRHANLVRGRAEVRTATRQDLNGLTECHDSGDAFLNRFEANDHCAVAVLDGRVIGYQWFCNRPSYMEERYSYKIDVPPDALYEYDIFILPEYRLSGLWFKFHCLYLRELMQKLHRERLIGMVDYGNHLSMSTHLRFGFRLVRMAFVIKVFGKAISLTRSLQGETTALPRWISAPGAVRTRPIIGPAHATSAAKTT